MSDLPPLTPLQALRLFEDDPSATIVWEGWTFTMDGPAMSPPSVWAPEAERDDHVFFVRGEPGDPIDETSEWIE